MFNSGSSQAKASFVTVNQCRICGAVIPSVEGVNRHGQACRFPDEIKLLNPDIQQMNNLKFPCPIVAIKRLLDVDNHNNNGSESPKARVSNRSSARKQPPINLRSFDELCLQNTVKVEMDAPFIKYEEEYSNEDEEEDDEDAYERESSDSENGTTQMENDHRPPTVTGYLNAAPRYSCPVKHCQFSTLESPHKLKRHFIKHLKNNPYTCPLPVCKVKCDSISKLRVHINIHLGRGGVTCKKCGVSYSREDGLRKHDCKIGKNNCGPGPSTLKCSIDEMIGHVKSCYDKFNSKGLLSRNERKLKTCNEDEDEDDELRIFKMHRRINIDTIIENDPVFIRVCKEQPRFKELILKRSLLKRRKNKMQPSTKERLPCGHCEKSFKSVKDYDQHQLKEHTKRPFECQICRRDFHKEVYLQKHLKLFECKLDMKYMKRLRSSGMWACMKCGHEVKFPDQLRRHWKEIHNFRIPSHRKSDLKKIISSSASSGGQVRVTPKGVSKLKKTKLKVAVADGYDDEGADLDLSIVKIECECEPPVKLTMNDIENIKVGPDITLKVEMSDLMSKI